MYNNTFTLVYHISEIKTILRVKPRDDSPKGVAQEYWIWFGSVGLHCTIHLSTTMCEPYIQYNNIPYPKVSQLFKSEDFNRGPDH